MTRSAAAILRSEAEITALASRTEPDTDDPVLNALAAWVADLDRHPVHAIVCEPRPESLFRGSVAGRVVALTLALTLSSTGVAAAVNGDPWGPLNFVVSKIKTIGHGSEPGRPSLGLPEAAVPDALGPGDRRKRHDSAERHQVSRGHRSGSPSTDADSTGPIVIEGQREQSQASSQPGGGSTPQHHRVVRVIAPPQHNPRPHHEPAASPLRHHAPPSPLPPEGPILPPDKPGGSDPPPTTGGSGG